MLVPVLVTWSQEPAPRSRMDPNAWQAYHQAAQAYTNRFGSGGSGGGDEGGGPGPPALRV